MEARHLEDAHQALGAQHDFDQVEEIGKVGEGGEDIGQDQQRGFDVLGRGIAQKSELALEIVEQGVFVLRGADHVTHLALDMHGLGEGAQIQADHCALQPFARGGDDFGVAGFGDGHQLYAVRDVKSLRWRDRKRRSASLVEAPAFFGL